MRGTVGVDLSYDAAGQRRCAAFRPRGRGGPGPCPNELAVIAHQRGSRMLRRDLRGDEVLVIGDTPLDVECGKKIDARVLAVATGGFPVDQLEAHKPTWAVRDLTEISAEEVCR